MTDYVINETSHENLPPHISNEKVAHFIWCALISLYLRKQEKGEMSPESENFHLMRWCSRAMRNKSFANNHAETLRFLTQNWQESGLACQLHQYLLHMWIACI